MRMPATGMNDIYTQELFISNHDIFLSLIVILEIADLRAVVTRSALVDMRWKHRQSASFHLVQRDAQIRSNIEKLWLNLVSAFL